MVRVFPLAPIERISKKAGAERISAGAVRAIRDAILDKAEKIAADAVAVSQHTGRVTVKAKDIKIVSK
jgi:histone H3/H4